MTMNPHAKSALRVARNSQPASEVIASKDDHSQLPWRVALHFHPDRVVPSTGRTALDSLLCSGQYVSQFASGISNGLLQTSGITTRHDWESILFDHAYDDAAPGNRPVYGALTLLDESGYGPARRFGSAYLVLKASTLHRTTIGYPDSASGPPQVFGLVQSMKVVEAALRRLDEDRSKGLDLLSDYVEAHVHGGIKLPADLEYLVLDPTHRERFASTIRHMEDEGWDIRYHAGYKLSLADFRHLAPVYKDEDTAVLGSQLVDEAGDLTTVNLGQELVTARTEPETDLQTLKYVWHCLARYGGDDSNASAALCCLLATQRQAVTYSM